GGFLSLAAAVLLGFPPLLTHASGHGMSLFRKDRTMHDVKAIRDDRDGFVRALGRRGLDGAAIADDILARDKALRDLLGRLQSAQARRNEASKLIGQAKANSASWNRRCATPWR